MINKYLIIQALDYYKRRIREQEDLLKKENDPRRQEAIKDIINDYYERGLQAISFAKPNEVDPDTIDYFLRSHS